MNESALRVIKNFATLFPALLFFGFGCSKRRLLSLGGEERLAFYGLNSGHRTNQIRGILICIVPRLF